MTYTFVIPGPPTPWTVWPRRGPLPPAFERMQAYQHVIQLYLRREWGDQPPLSDAVTLVIDFHIPLPRLETGEKYRFPIRRGHDPDVTNLVKACEDALQGIVLVNDAQVVSCTGQKRWCPADYPTAENPGETVIRVRTVLWYEQVMAFRKEE